MRNLVSCKIKNIFGVQEVNKLFKNNKIIYEDDLAKKYEGKLEKHDLILIYRPNFFKNKEILPTKLKEIFLELDTKKRFEGLFAHSLSFEIFNEMIKSYSHGWHLISSDIVDGTEGQNYLEQTVVLDKKLRQIRSELIIKITLGEPNNFNNQIKELRKAAISKLEAIGPELVNIKANNYRHSFMDYVIDSIIINLLSDEIYNKNNFVWTKESMNFSEKTINAIAMIGYQDENGMLGYAKPDACFDSLADLATTFSVPL